MSQQQSFGGTSIPGMANIEFIAGNTGGNVPPDPATHVLNLIGDTVQGVSVNGTPGTFTETITVADATTTQKGVVLLDSNVNTGTGTTISAVTANIITIPLGAVAGAFQFSATVKGFETTGPSAAGYEVFATFRTTGAAATLVGDQDIFNEDAALAAADAYFIASGNNAVLQVLGVAGLTINWTAKSVKL